VAAPRFEEDLERAGPVIPQQVLAAIDAVGTAPVDRRIANADVGVELDRRGVSCCVRSRSIVVAAAGSGMSTQPIAASRR
jgi:hypothetical protein